MRMLRHLYIPCHLLLALLELDLPGDCNKIIKLKIRNESNILLVKKKEVANAYFFVEYAVPRIYKQKKLSYL